MPVATSIPNLIQQTVDSLKGKHFPKTLEEAGVQVPSRSWVLLQFSPKNPMSSSALNYTGAQNLKHKVQHRTLKAYNIDAHYVAAAYKYMRSYGLWLHEQLHQVNSGFSVISASCDDKCKVLPPFTPHYSYVMLDVKGVGNNLDNVVSLVAGEYRRAVIAHSIGRTGQG
jgi:hypothetical protein